MDKNVHLKVPSTPLNTRSSRTDPLRWDDRGPSGWVGLVGSSHTEPFRRYDWRCRVSNSECLEDVFTFHQPSATVSELLGILSCIDLAFKMSWIYL